MVEPPTVQLRDGSVAEGIEYEYWMSILFKVWKLHLKPQGLEFSRVLEEIREKYPEIEEARREASRRNPLRHYINVDEDTTEDEVRDAFRMISRMHESRPGGGRSERDPLTALQCAILYDKHNERDPEDPRRKKWTYEKLYTKFDEISSARAAKAYVRLGRELLQNKPQSEE